MAEHYRQWHQSAASGPASTAEPGASRPRRSAAVPAKELNEFNPLAESLSRLTNIQAPANSGQLLSTVISAAPDGTGGRRRGQSAEPALYREALVSELVVWTASFPALDMLEEAVIQLSEASDELRHYHDRLTLDPNFVCLNFWSSGFPGKSRWRCKHQVMPEELPAVYQAMLEEQRLLTTAPARWNPSASRWSNIISWRWHRAPAARPAPGQRRRANPAYHREYVNYLFDAGTGSSRLRSLLMNAISPPTAPIILSSVSPLTRVSRCSRSRKWPLAANCRVLRWRFR